MLTELLSNCLPATTKDVVSTIIQRVTDAYNNVPFYKKLLDDHALSPKDFKDLPDYVHKFPRTTTREYRRVMSEYGAAFVMDRRYADKPMKKLLSGGSSGTPVHVLRTYPEYERIHGANTVYTFIMGGVRPWHKIMALIPPWDIRERQHELQRLGIFRRYDASFVEHADTILDRISEHGVNVLFGRVSMMRMLAERCLEAGRSVHPLEVILPGAEIVTPDSRRLLCDVFKPRLYREIYGSTETGLIALKKADGDYEVNFRSVFFTLSNPNVDHGITTGEIAITSLHAAAAPILMLELGDVVSCRRYDRLLELKTSITSIMGRVSEYVVSRDGEKISASLFYSWLTNEPFVRQFRIVQDRVGECDIFLRLADCSVADKAKLEARLRGQLGENVNATIRYVDRVPFDENGKTRIVVNRIGSTVRSVANSNQFLT